jgi:hypothetical protein
MRIARKSLEASRSVRCLWRQPHAPDGYSTAVSLHSHTLHSRENLAFVPRVLKRVPPISAVLHKIEEDYRRRHGNPIPFERAFWRPPLNPLAAYHLEAAQIANGLSLRPLVSITDHDTMEACADLRAIGVAVPYSVEWTVPYHRTVFHIGVHNLPPDRARGFEAAMAECTAAPARERIAELLAAVHDLPEALLVLNHPFSCEFLVEAAEHARLLMDFLNEFGQWMHALELNGLQPATDNLETIRLAAARGLPMISGGDRHCTEPNANVNLTNAASFAEFVHEIRVEQRSSVLFMQQYRDPIPARYIEFIWQAVRNYPEFTGRVRWEDRVFFQRESGEIFCCGKEWPHGGPAALRGFISLVGLLASPGVRAMLCMTMGRVGSLEPEVS